MIPMPSRTIHTKGPTGQPYITQPYGVHPGQCLYSVSRQFMNEYILEQAMNHENVKMSFDVPVEMVHEDGSLTLNVQGQPTQRIRSKFTIGPRA